MATTLSYGYVLPEDGDHGSVFFPALEDDITQLNSHNHNGTNSALLTVASIVGVADTTSLVAASWVLVSGGVYRILVTTPPGVNYSSYGRCFEITNGTDTGCTFYPTTVKVSATTYYVYSNDNTITATILYLV